MRSRFQRASDAKIAADVLINGEDFFSNVEAVFTRILTTGFLCFIQHLPHHPGQLCHNHRLLRKTLYADLSGLFFDGLHVVVPFREGRSAPPVPGRRPAVVAGAACGRARAVPADQSRCS